MATYVAPPGGTIVRLADGQLKYLGGGTNLAAFGVSGAQLAEMVANGRAVDAADLAVDPTPTPADPGTGLTTTSAAGTYRAGAVIGTADPSAFIISPAGGDRTPFLTQYAEPAVWWDSVRSRLCGFFTDMSTPQIVYAEGTGSQDPTAATWSAPVVVIGQGNGGIAGAASRTSVLVVGGTVYVYAPDDPAGGNLKAWSFPYGASPVGALTALGTVLAPSGTALGFVNTSVVQDASGFLLLAESNIAGGAHWAIYAARASSPAGPFALVQATPVGGLGFGGAFGGPDLHYDGGGYTLIYHACPTSGAASPTEIYRAFSTDGLNWRREKFPLVARVTADENQQTADPNYVATPQWAGLLWSAALTDSSQKVTGSRAALREQAGLVLISRTVLTADAAGVTFDKIPQTFEDLIVQWSGRNTDVSNSNAKAFLRLNNDQTVGSYFNVDSYAYGTGTTVGTTGADQDAGALTRLFVGGMPYNGSPAGVAGQGEIVIGSYARTAFNKNITWRAMHASAVSGNGALTVYQGAGMWVSTAAVSRLDFLPAGTNLKAGTVVSLYGRR